VRRKGYVFNVLQLKGPQGKAAVLKVYVPKEWKGLEVRVGNELVKVVKMLPEGKLMFAEVHATVNGPAVTVSERGEGEALSKVHRF
jgi:hypothetical protein